MRPYLLLLYALLLALNASGQSTLVAGGGEATGTGGHVGYSIGQVAYTAPAAPTGSSSAGVQQAYVVIPTSLDDQNDQPASASVYPNPAEAALSIDLHKAGPGPTVVQLFDDRGRLLREELVYGPMGTTDLRDLANGTYVLLLLKEGRAIGKFSVIKQ